jgi:hypothetical protein
MLQIGRRATKVNITKQNRLLLILQKITKFFLPTPRYPGAQTWAGLGWIFLYVAIIGSVFGTANATINVSWRLGNISCRDHEDCQHNAGIYEEDFDSVDP